jgi:DMSO reductase family type II enzyme chaperone
MTSTVKRSTDNGEVDVALGRSCLYRWLSRAFRYPDAELAADLKGSVLTFFEGTFDLLAERARNALRPALDSLRAAVTDLDLAQLQSDHRRVFGHIESSFCPPYETRYGNHHLFQQTQQLADIAGFYRAFGLDLSDDANERPDHLAIELEFLHFLCFKEAYGLKHHGPEQVEVCRDAEVKFLREHLLTWAPSFAKRLQEAAGGGFYERLAAFMAAFLSTEAARWGCRRVEEAALQPVEFPPEGGSFSCGLGAQGVEDLIGQR